MAWFKAVPALILYFVFSPSAHGLGLKYLAHAELPHRMSVQKTKLGGLSGIYYSSDEKLLYAVSDDRGKINEPRLYTFKVQLSEGQRSEIKLEVTPKDVLFLHKRNEKGPLHGVIDLEAIAPLPWGNFLLPSEGDNNHKPRLSPELFDVKPDASWVRSFPLPEQLVPEKSGKQTIGIQNNKSVEGLSTSPSGKILAATEAPLVQDARPDEKWVRFIQYESPEAWIIRPTKQFIYPLDTVIQGSGVFLENGVSEILFVDENQVLVLERAVFLNMKEVFCDVRIYLVNLSGAQDVGGLGSLAKEKEVRPLTKKLIYQLKDLQKTNPEFQKIENFEGMSWGPELKNHGRILLLVSDDNFMRNQRTQFLAFELIP
ncbi:MAG: 3-phytase [Oligoflexia bacterium]|nr:MAG: 3-phytase [Oligoflexia bacterium]